VIGASDADLFLADFGGVLVASGVAAGTKGILSHRIIDAIDESGNPIRYPSAVLRVKAGSFDVAVDTAFTHAGVSYKTRGTPQPEPGDGAFESVPVVRA
jgi:hypothetical protein